jgi:hypothetical protein
MHAIISRSRQAIYNNGAGKTQLPLPYVICQLFLAMKLNLAVNEGSSIGLKNPTELMASYLQGIGWGGRIRTFTVLINSEVSYQLDHAPVDLSE